MADKNKQIAQAVLEAVGGKENITFVAHCMTRLRFNLKDESIPNTDEIKKIPGILGSQKVGVQYQIIVGQNVDKVYDNLCKIADIKPEAAIDEKLDLDSKNEKLTVKKILGNILDYLSGSMFALIPILMAAGLFKTVYVILGPAMLNVISQKSNLYILMSMLYNAGFYFLPIYLGYTSAKKLGVNTMMGMFMGAILIEPTFVSMATAKTRFSVYGIPCTPYNYTQTVMPILLSVWAMMYIERFFKKHLPDTIQTVFTPFLTMVIAVPISLCALAPLGNYLGTLIVGAIFGFYNTFGIVAVTLLCAFSILLTLTGMHVAIGTIAMTQLLQTGNDPFFFVAGIVSNFTIMGMALGASLRLKEKNEKSTAFGFFVSSILGGVTEPALYGIGVRYKTPFYGLFAGGAAAGLYAGLSKVACHTLPPTSNFLAVVAFFGSTRVSVINGVITCIIGFTVSCVVTFLFAFNNSKNTKVNES